MAFIKPFIFAFLYRCRGGFLGLSHTTLARLIWWAIPCAIFGFSLIGAWGSLCGLLAFLGLLIPHARYQSIASVPNLLGMGSVNAIRAALILLPIGTTHPAVLVFATLGMFSGVAYYFLNKNNVVFDSHINFPGLVLFGKTITQPGDFAVSASEWAEVATGFTFGIIFDLVGRYVNG